MDGPMGIHGWGRYPDLGAAYVQVTEKLLAAEEQKLRLLKADIDATRESDDVAATSSKVK